MLRRKFGKQVRWQLLALLLAVAAAAVAIPQFGSGPVAEAVTMDGISQVSGEDGRQQNPAVVDVDNTGQVLVAYESRNGDQRPAIYSRTSFDNGSAWLPEQFVTRGQDEADFVGFHSRGVFGPDLARESGGGL